MKFLFHAITMQRICIINMKYKIVQMAVLKLISKTLKPANIYTVSQI